jgi:uncharacterized protein YodC (DUF2158 family)
VRAYNRDIDGLIAEHHAPRRVIGAVVQLKSGGFSMTVEGIDDDTATCVWIDKSGKFQRQNLSFGVLKRGTEGIDVTIIAPNFLPQSNVAETANA